MYPEYFLQTVMTLTPGARKCILSQATGKRDKTPSVDQNYPIACALVALASWNYCSQEQSQTFSQDCTILFTLLNNVYKNEIRHCHLMLMTRSIIQEVDPRN